MAISGLSIIITYYNGEKYIDYLLASLEKSLQHVDISNEIIIIDDNPDADTIFELTKRYQNVKIIKNKVNMGIAKSRNVGLHNAKFEYVHVIDQDDFIDEMFYSEMLKKNKKMYVSNTMIYSNNKKTVRYKKTFKYFFNSISVKKMFEYGNYFCSVGSCVFQKKLLKTGFLSSSAQGSDDFYMYIELIHNTRKKDRIFVENSCFIYRKHETNTSKSVNFYKSSLEIFNNFVFLYPKFERYRKLYTKTTQVNSFLNFKKRLVRRFFIFK